MFYYIILKQQGINGRQPPRPWARGGPFAGGCVPQEGGSPAASRRTAGRQSRGAGSAGRAVGEVSAVPRRRVSQVPPYRCFSFGSGVPLRPRRGPALPCPLWAGGPRRAPGPGRRRPVAGGAASARRSLPVGGIPRPRRAPPAAERSGGQRQRQREREREGAGAGARPAAGRGTGQTPGSRLGKRRRRLCRRCSPSFSPFLPFREGTCRVATGASGRCDKDDKSRSPGSAVTAGLNCQRWGLAQLAPGKQAPRPPPRRREDEGLQYCPSQPGGPRPPPRPPRPARSRRTRALSGALPARRGRGGPGEPVLPKSRRCHTLRETPVRPAWVLNSRGPRLSWFVTTAVLPHKFLNSTGLPIEERGFCF